MNNSWDEERRNYRGGQSRPIWIVDLKHDLVSPPWTDFERCRSRLAGPVQSISFPIARWRGEHLAYEDGNNKVRRMVTKFQGTSDVKTLDSGSQCDSSSKTKPDTFMNLSRRRNIVNITRWRLPG